MQYCVKVSSVEEVDVHVVLYSRVEEVVVYGVLQASMLLPLSALWRRLMLTMLPTDSSATQPVRPLWYLDETMLGSPSTPPGIKSIGNIFVTRCSPSFQVLSIRYKRLFTLVIMVQSFNLYIHLGFFLHLPPLPPLPLNKPLWSMLLLLSLFFLGGGGQGVDRQF